MNPVMRPVMNQNELDEFIRAEFPQVYITYPGFSVVSVAPGLTTVRMETNETHIRAGGTISGPTLFALADMGGYACVLSHIGREALAVTTNLNLNFMRKADPGPIVGESRILKLGKRLMVYDCTITSEVSAGIIAHATGTYAIPPK